MTRAAPVLLPALMGERDAAVYLGISPSTLRALGLPRRVLGARRLYDRADLDAYAASLPYEGDAAGLEDAATCDEAFGL